MRNPVPAEIRKIVFQLREVVAAAREYHQKRHEQLPPGNVLGVSFDQADGIAAVIRIDSDAGTGPIEARLPPGILAAALIMYCINRNIPMPTRAAKRLVLAGDSVALILEINGSGGESALHPGGKTRTAGVA